jgi:heme exporter protein A
LLDEWAETGVSLEALVTHVLIHEVGHHFRFFRRGDARDRGIWRSERSAAAAHGECRLLRGGRLLFEGIDLRLEHGGAAVVGGPNGVGKSSLLRVAAGLLRFGAGRVERRGTVALSDEGLALDERLTLQQALGFWARLDGSRAEAGMEPMGLLPLADVPVRMLSTGQRKRAGLARVVASGSPLWLLDEPANGLDKEVWTGLPESWLPTGSAAARSSLPPITRLGLQSATAVTLS